MPSAVFVIFELFFFPNLQLSRALLEFLGKKNPIHHYHLAAIHQMNHNRQKGPLSLRQTLFRHNISEVSFALLHRNSLLQP
jgi:hypothetical protein